MKTKPTKLEVLLSEVDALCKAHVGKSPKDHEPWALTLQRLDRIYPLVRTIKRQIEKVRP
jgi:hypothetical protein